MIDAGEWSSGLKAFLEENGHSKEAISALYRDEYEEEGAIEAELLPKNEEEKYALAMEGETVTWDILKRRVLVINNSTYRNPYFRRTDHGYKRAGTAFMRDYRAYSKYHYVTLWSHC